MPESILAKITQNTKIFLNNKKLIAVPLHNTAMKSLTFCSETVSGFRLKFFANPSIKVGSFAHNLLFFLYALFERFITKCSSTLVNFFPEPVDLDQ